MSGGARRGSPAFSALSLLLLVAPLLAFAPATLASVPRGATALPSPLLAADVDALATSSLENNDRAPFRVFAGDELGDARLLVFELGYPETRVRGFGLPDEARVGDERSLRLGVPWACDESSGGKASGSGKFRIFDPAGSSRSASAFGWNRLFQGREYLGLIDAYDFRARTLWPELGRFGQEDPAGTVDSLNRYQALGANWGTYSDPHGLYVGEDGAIISLETAAQNIRTVAKDCKGTDSGCLIRRLYFSHLAATPGIQAMTAPLNQDRYLFTDEAGWLDLRHVYQLAHLALNKWMFGVDAEYAGEVIEEDQAERGHHSAFSYEDLPSNHQGIKIANLLKYSRSPADDLINYLRTLRPVDRSQAEADDLGSILNFSVEPVLSSHEAGLRATKSFVYKPSESQTKNQKWIRKLDIGFGRNPGWKERNPRTTPIRILARRMVWERWAPELDFEPGRRAH